MPTPVKLIFPNRSLILSVLMVVKASSSTHTQTLLIRLTTGCARLPGAPRAVRWQSGFSDSSKIGENVNSEYQKRSIYPRKAREVSKHEIGNLLQTA